ncbi:phage minor head protein [Embleya sp. AB8]|uniref:phage minor head protein n=1 Tax=Embleya sp. AB8 TaxID=3156304 RepID=UPI003C7647E2
MDADLKAALDAAEADIAATVADVLADVADEFAATLDESIEIVAARFSVSRIASMWRARVPRIVRRLLGVVETAATTAAEQVDAPLPEGWDDLPGRYDDGSDLPASLGSYVDTTEHLMRAVGNRLSAVAVAELAAGLDAGEDVEQLRVRLRAMFAREGVQLGSVREERIARTESGRAWNTATLAAARDLAAPGRPLVKQWLTRFDTRVRDAHASVNGTVKPIDEAFTVAGVSMSGPHDASAPPELVINCRCGLALAPASRAAAFDSQEPPAKTVNDPRETRVSTTTAAADGSHLQGAMIALMPTPGDAAHLVVPGGEAVEELHLTLQFLGGDGTAWAPEQRAALIDNVRKAATALGPITGRAFGVALWNSDSDTPSWVWSVGDDRDRPDGAPTLVDAARAAAEAVAATRDTPEMPAQHSPWVAHVCAAYSDDPALLTELKTRLGPIAFDRIRIAFAGDYTDIPLGPQEEPMEPDTTADGLPARRWSTPGDNALAFENQETGDGRIFAAGSLQWDTGPWPLQYADEMLMGHEGAELAGAIETMARDGDRLAGTGVIYTSRPAGQDAVLLLEEGAPLGVSVDLDDVALKFVDRTPGYDDEEFALAASLGSVVLASASLLRLPDGAWLITARSAAEWSASGSALSRAQHTVQIITGSDGVVSADTVRAAFAGAFTAAAGDADDPDGGIVVHSETTGDFLLRITRARVRGATLVAMPAYDRARIVLDPITDEEPVASAVAATAPQPSEAQQRVIAYVSVCPGPVGAREVAQALGMRMEVAKGHLTRAAVAGRLVRLASGLYVGVTTMPEGPHAATLDGPDSEVDGGGDDLLASAWTAMRDMPPMPAAWFREPTAAELPPGSGGVHYANGRIYGWVAQAGEPHAGMPGRNLTIDSLGDIDTTHFLRAKFRLDDGSQVKVGAFTMNVGHHRDGAECENAACQFDDSRTVAGIVTVGMNARGMWFSGAASPWLSEWDRQVFTACQPSYHMKQGRGGKWQLRAVLTVPVPGHSSPLLAAAVAERAQVALAASAASVPTHPDSASGHRADTATAVSARVSGQVTAHPADLVGHRPDSAPGQRPETESGEIVAAVDALLTSPEFLNRFTEALERREANRIAAREEVERLLAAVAPARQEIAANMAGTVTTGGM